MKSDTDAIGDVLIRYATAIDTRDWVLFRTCFSEAVDADYGDIGHFDGLDALTGFMDTAHVGFRSTNHMMSNFVIDIDGDRATARSYVHVVLVFADDPDRWVESVGGYDDVLARTDDGWRITARTFHHTLTRFAGAV